MPTESENSRRWLVPSICLALAALTCAVFGQTLTHQFVDFDDNAYVYKNPVVARGLTLQGLAWAFNGAHAHNWHPLTWVSHMLDCQLYGLKPAGHHLTNLILHTAAAIVLFLSLRRMTGKVWPGACVAVIFAVHPLRVESVAWVAERKDVLSGLFFVLTIAAYWRFVQRPKSPSRYVLVALLFVLGLMCKPMLVTLPLVLLLLDYWPLRRQESVTKLAIEKAPLFAISLASCVVTLLAQKAAIQSTESYPLALRLANAVVSCAVYLRQMVWPEGLAVLYPYPHHGLPPLEVALSALLLAAVSIIAWTERKTRPWLLVGWLWYLIMLLPALGIVQAGNQAHADRYTYLPQIGIYLSITWLLADWLANRVVLGGLAAGVIAALAVCAWRQTGYWKNSETLWARALACTTDNAMAHYGMGNVFVAKKDWPDAAIEFQKAVMIKPDYVEAHSNLGIALFNEGKTGEAIAQYQMALELQPDFADARANLGDVYLQKQDWDQAIDWYQKALQLDPDRATARGNLGIALYRKGRTDEAITQFRLAVALNPGDTETHYNLGEALRQAGHALEAAACYQNAIQIDPTYAAARYGLAHAYLSDGKRAEAADQFRRALQSEPGNPKFQNSLAWFLATSPDASLRDGKEAWQLARQASAQAGGKNPIYLRTLAAALAEIGKFDEARECALQAKTIVLAAGRRDMATDLDKDLKRFAAGLPLRQE